MPIFSGINEPVTQCNSVVYPYVIIHSTEFNGTDESISGHTLKSQNRKLSELMHESLFSIKTVGRRVRTFSIWSASRRSLASLRLGLNVSISSSVLTDAPCLEFTSSLVVI